MPPFGGGHVEDKAVWIADPSQLESPHLILINKIWRIGLPNDPITT